MPNAFHAICHRKDGKPQNLSTINASAGLYGSGWWEVDEPAARALVGGFLYLHEMSSERSHFAGQIEGIERRDETGRVEFRVRRLRDLKDRFWRGEKAKQTPKHNFRIVPANHPEEQMVG